MASFVLVSHCSGSLEVSVSVRVLTELSEEVRSVTLSVRSSEVNMSVAEEMIE